MNDQLLDKQALRDLGIGRDLAIRILREAGGVRIGHRLWVRESDFARWYERQREAQSQAGQ